MRKRLIVFLQSLLILLLLCGVAYAAGESARVSTFGAAFSNALGKVGNKLSGAAEKVFWFLAILQMFWNCYQLLLEGKLESQSFVMTFCKTVVILCIFEFFVLNAFSILNDISKFITGALGNESSDLSGIIQTAFKMAKAPKDALDEFADDKCGFLHWIQDIRYVGALFMIGIGDFIILIALFMAYVSALVTQAKLCIVISFAILAMGFSGSQYTRDIAINGMRSTLAVSVELLVIYTLMGVSSDVFNSFYSVKINSWTAAYNFAWECTLAGIVLAALYQQVPGVVSGMFGQGGGGGGNALVGASMAMSAYSMAKSAASMAKSAGGKVASGAGKIAGGTVGTVSAIKQHMPSAPPSISGSKSGLQKAQEGFGRFSQGVKGAGKEAFSNRVSSMKEAFSRGVSNSADKVLGKKHNDGAGKG